MNMFPRARTKNIVVQELNDETLVYDLDRNKAVCLNETSAAVWKSCDGDRRISEITIEVAKLLKKPVTEQLVWFAIDQLKAERLFSNAEEIEARFEGLSRREVIRKIGVTSMVALPIVSSIVAPPAIAAQSSCFAVGTCIQAGDNQCPPACLGKTVNFTSHLTTNGTCGGAGSPGFVNCVAPGVTSPGNDILVTSVV